MSPPVPGVFPVMTPVTVMMLVPVCPLTVSCLGVRKGWSSPAPPTGPSVRQTGGGVTPSPGATVSHNVNSFSPRSCPDPATNLFCLQLCHLLEMSFQHSFPTPKSKFILVWDKILWLSLTLSVLAPCVVPYISNGFVEDKASGQTVGEWRKVKSKTEKWLGRSQPVGDCAVCLTVPAKPQRQRRLQERQLGRPPQLCPRQVHGAPRRPQERDGGGPQPGARHGRKVRGEIKQLQLLSFS